MLAPDIETLTPCVLATRRAARWRIQRQRVAATSSFYSDKIGRRLATARLAELPDLPLTDKDELRASLEADPPFGRHLACDEADLVRVHRTSGITGRGMTLALTAADAAITTRVGARSMVAAGLRPDDRVVHCLNYQLWTGGVTDHLILEASGATVVPFGIGDPQRLLDTIMALRITAISCTPSYPALLEHVLRDHTRLAPRDLGLRIALFGGEAGLDQPGFRSRLETTWGFAARNANYGLSEVLSIIAGQCEHTTDLHFHAADTVHPELVSAATDQPLVIEDGAVGELVLTHVAKQAQPLVRYRTGDVIAVTGTETCACGRTSFRFRVAGRTDDMFNVRGVNVFPTALRAVIDEHPDVASGQFRIVLRGAGPYDRIELRAEAASGVAPESYPQARARLEQAIKTRIGASAVVVIVPEGAVGRTADKTSWIEREPA